MKGRARNIGLWLLIPVLLFGVYIGLLMTWHHDYQLFEGQLDGQLKGCEESGEVNCDAVNTSAYSEILGIPKQQDGISMLCRLSPWLLVGLAACASLEARSCGTRVAKEYEPAREEDGGAPDTAISCIGDPATLEQQDPSVPDTDLSAEPVQTQPSPIRKPAP